MAYTSVKIQEDLFPVLGSRFSDAKLLQFQSGAEVDKYVESMQNTAGKHLGVPGFGTRKVNGQITERWRWLHSGFVAPVQHADQKSAVAEKSAVATPVKAAKVRKASAGVHADGSGSTAVESSSSAAGTKRRRLDYADEQPGTGKHKQPRKAGTATPSAASSAAGGTSATAQLSSMRRRASEAEAQRDKYRNENRALKELLASYVKTSERAKGLLKA